MAAVVVAVAAPAIADNKPADESFARGRALMKDKKFAPACAAFEDSYRLDPAQGTLFNLADCETQLGKLASAWNHYRELAKTDTNAERRAMSSKLATDLAPRVPKLVVAVDNAPHAHLAIDGHDSSDLVGVDVPIDLGPHTVAVTADGFADWQQAVTIDREGTITKLAVHLTPPGAPATAAQPVATAAAHDAPPPSSSRHTLGVTLTIAGGAALATGVVFGGLAYSEFQDAKTAADRAGKSDSAGRLGDLSTGLVIAGAVVAATGVYLWRSSHAATATTAFIAPTGLVVAGSF
nr:hypothetical protein [Kofleriaceae bacterium]